MRMLDKYMLALCLVALMGVCVVIGYMGGKQGTINKMARGEITIVTNVSIIVSYKMR